MLPDSSLYGLKKRTSMAKAVLFWVKESVLEDANTKHCSGLHRSNNKAPFELLVCSKDYMKCIAHIPFSPSEFTVVCMSFQTQFLHIIIGPQH